MENKLNTVKTEINFSSWEGDVTKTRKSADKIYCQKHKKPVFKLKININISQKKLFTSTRDTTKYNTH